MSIKKTALFVALVAALFTSKTYGQADADWYISVWDMSKEGGTTTTDLRTNLAGTFEVKYVEIDATGNEIGTPISTTLIGTTTAPVVITGLTPNARYRLYAHSGTGTLRGLRMVENDSDNQRLEKVEQWGSTKWTSLEFAFNRAENMDVTADDVPDLSGTKNISRMFRYCSSLLYSNGKIADWDVANVTQMGSMFAFAPLFNQNIGGWNVANVTDMSGMFYGAAAFNQDIGGWDVAKVTTMLNMFNSTAAFNQDIGGWNVANVTIMRGMFRDATAFNQDIGSWNVAKVTTMLNMFAGATAFNQDIGGWNVTNVEVMANMFYGATSFNRPLNNWGNKTANVNNMSNMFRNATAFNQDIGSWNVANVTTMLNMFYGAAAFNQDIGSWNVAKVTIMQGMFYDAAAFNQDIGGWNVANVETMASMFYGATAFNQDISGWNVAKVTNTTGMFNKAAAFNQPLNNWGNKTANVNNMSNMFREATAFNQDISGWDVSSVTDMISMFNGATAFNQDLGSWNLNSLNKGYGMFSYSGMDCSNYSKTLIGWAANTNTASGVNFSNQNNMVYNRTARNPRQQLITNKGWTISGDRYDALCGGLAYVWTGAVSTDYNTLGNWDGTTSLPAPGTDIEFATPTNSDYARYAARDLHVPANDPKVIRNLINASDKNLVVTPASFLTINGTVTDGNADAGTIIVQADPADQQPAGTLIFTTPGENAAVAATAQFYSRAYQCADCGTYKQSWQYFGIPVQSAATFPVNDVAGNETVNVWTESIDGNKWVTATSFEAFKGYEITNDVTTQPSGVYSFAGTLNVGDAPVALSRTADVIYSGVNLVGNSYTAAIPISEAAFVFPANVNKTLYLFNTGTRDEWRKLNGTTVTGHKSGQYLGVPVNLGGQDNFPDRIPSTHAFMVLAEEGFTSGNLTINYNQLVKNEKVNLGNGETVVTRGSNDEYDNYDTSLPNLTIDVIGKGSADRLWIFTKEGTTFGFDNGWDGFKLKENGISQLYAIGNAPDEKFQVATVPELNNMLLGFDAPANGRYTLEFALSEHFAGRYLYLYDIDAGVRLRVINNGFYSFDAKKGDTGARFRLSYQNDGFTADSLPEVVVSALGKQIVIANNGEENYVASVFTVAGKLMRQMEVKAGSRETTVVLDAGVYIVRLQNDQTNVTKKVVAN